MQLYATCEIRETHAARVKWYVDRAQKHRARYEAVAAVTGVPWFVICCIHAMESSFSFGTHLHNGDPLSQRTYHVPAGRPKTHEPPFTWEESAIDALGYDGATSIRDWTLPRILFFLEGYNGWGYRTGAGRATTPPRRSAYLWSFTTHYSKGRYVSDGKFDPESVSDQAGCAAILRGMEARGLIEPLIAAKPATTDDDVTWFEVHRLNDNGRTITGVVAKAGATNVALWAGISKIGLIDFVRRFRNADHVLVSDKTAAWPGVLTVDN